MRSPKFALLMQVVFVVGPLTVTASRATTIAGGNIINQTWSPAGNPYIVQGDITVPVGAFLTINAGVNVLFASTDGLASGADASRVELIVNGVLTVAGTAASPVTFQAQTGTAAGIWYGIEPRATATSVTIDYALIQHAVNGIRSTVTGSGLSVTNTRIDTCTYGVYTSDGTSSFDSVQIASCPTSGFYHRGRGTVTLKNVISLPAGNYGVFAAAETGPLNLTIVNATINGGPSYGLYCGSASPIQTTTVTAQNLIVTNNATGVFRLTALGPVNVTLSYSDVWNNTTNLTNVASGPGMISADPSYVGPTNFHLTAGSVAIDTGNGGASIPNHDFDGNTRPQDGDGVGGAAFDMGAYEFPAPSAILGFVPETPGGPQPVLTIGTPDHVSLSLQWGAACGGATTDYAIYEGTIGSWYSHVQVPGFCSTSGGLTAGFVPAAGNRYYLVVPLNASTEGIYGHGTSGAIPVSNAACRAAQNAAACP
jgi:hypothetical protein